MRSKIRAVVGSTLLVIQLTSKVATAQEIALRPIPEGADVIEPVAQNQKAPFAGQLFDNKTALRWGNYLEQCRVRLSLDVEQARKIGAAETEFWKTKAVAERERYDTVTTSYQNEVAKLEEELRSPPFYTTSWFGVVIGITGTVSAIAASAYLVNAANR